MNYPQLKNYEFTFGQYNGKKIKDIIDLSEYTPEKWEVVLKFAHYIAWLDENVEWFQDGHAIIDAIDARGDKLLSKMKKKGYTLSNKNQSDRDIDAYRDCDATEIDIYQ